MRLWTRLRILQRSTLLSCLGGVGPEAREPKWNAEKSHRVSFQPSTGERRCACPGVESGKAVPRLARSSQSHLCPSKDPEPMSGLREAKGGGERDSGLLAV